MTLSKESIQHFLKAAVVELDLGIVSVVRFKSIESYK